MTKRHAGMFKPGQSGNPAGRPPGASAIARLRAGIECQVPEIIESLTTAAKAGDVGAARLLLERVLPPVRATETPVELTLPEGTLTAKGEAVLQATADGTLAPGQGAQLIGAVAQLGRLAELDELARRIAALEARHANQS